MSPTHVIQVLYALVVKDLQARLRQTYLGFVWVLIYPLVLMLAFRYVFTRVSPLDTGGVPYSVFVWVCLAPWMYFQQGLLSATFSLVGGANLFRSVALPLVTIPVASLIARLVDFALTLSVLVALLAIHDVPISAEAWICLPTFIAQFGLMAGLGLLFATANVFYRDLGYLAQALVQVLLFVSPVFYAVSSLQDAGLLFFLNPMAHLLGIYRDALLYQKLPSLWAFSLLFALCWAVFALGYRCFVRFQARMVERV